MAAAASDEDPDEAALLRTAVPNAEQAVIGADGAEPAGKGAEGEKREASDAAKPAHAPGKASPSRPKPKVRETAILHITTKPVGAIVRTSGQVLGRTPINLHFRTGNIYELTFVKSGFAPGAAGARRRHEHEGQEDRARARAAARAAQAFALPPAPLMSPGSRVPPAWLTCAVALLAAACARPQPPASGRAPAPQPETSTPIDRERVLDQARAAALASIAKARASALSDVAKTIGVPSVERLVDDGDAVRARVTDAARDLAFARRSYETARAYADVLGGGGDPYDTARGALVKAYRAAWDYTLQPYALYVPRSYDPRRPWPLVVALHGASSNHRHMLRRVFGLDNQPGETDEEASRNEVQFPDVPALVVAPYGRGELMGYDGLGEEDVLRVIADVRRAYNVDAARISLTGLSMGGGGTWTIGLRHPELFAALAPVCGVTDVRKWIAPAERADYDLAALDAMSPVAFAENAAGLRVFIFHGDADPVVPVADSRRMVARFQALGWMGKTVTYTEYPGVDHRAWVPAYRNAELLRALAEIKRDPEAPRLPRKPVPVDRAVPTLFGKSLPRERPHLYVYGTHGAPEAARAARALAEGLADWGPGVAARFTVKADNDVTADDEASFDLVLVGVAPLNAVAAGIPMPPQLGKAGLGGDRAARWFAPSPFGHGHQVEVFGAETPAGFAKLDRFAVYNRDHWAPEANRPLIIIE